MATQIYEMEFDGYWRESNKGSVSIQSGIYCVYSCTYNANEKTVSLKKLIYIGESSDVRDRLSNHEKLSKWKKHLKSGEELCYSVTTISSSSRIRCEAAMINKHTPPENLEYVDNFPFDETTIKITGRKKFLYTNFTVYRH